MPGATTATPLLAGSGSRSRFAFLASPPMWLIHALLFSVEGIGIGFGTVIGKIGLADVDPIVFACYRDGLAFPILLGWSWSAERKMIARGDVPQLALAGFFLFLSNICYTIGVKESNAVIGAAWQAASPIFTAAIAIGIGWEKPTPLKLCGIGVAFAGSVFIIFFKQDLSSGGGFFGNVLFLINVTGYSLYCLATRPLLRKYPPLLITALSFFVVTVLLFAAALVAHADPTLGDDGPSPWHMTHPAALALAYFVFMFSVFLYAIITWSNQFVPASTVMAYTVVQPIAAALLSFMLIRTGFNDTHPDVQLSEPGWNALGAIGVVGGLALIVYNDVAERRQKAAVERAAGLEAAEGGEGQSSTLEQDERYVPVTLPKGRPRVQSVLTKGAQTGGGF